LEHLKCFNLFIYLFIVVYKKTDQHPPSFMIVDAIASLKECMGSS